MTPYWPSLKRALGYEGHEITMAGDGLAALDLARHRPPDLMVLDLMLPGMDAMEGPAERQIREAM